ncbi:UNVERIFIED_CONTAM: hypothetical protein Slati_1564600 [Sesamum latifolium]|uniref:DUF7054 domain-containing protein n=1 Tax=Sesamum latifolium TaxID=2727402 RepID=A0AAW2X7R5_9LAMI
MAAKMRRSISDKALLRKPMMKKKDDESKNNRFLITINVFGSAGPIRFVVDEDDNAAGVIATALKLYARGGRLPVLGSDINCFVIYPVNAGFDGYASVINSLDILMLLILRLVDNILVAALKPWEAIGSRGVRKLCAVQESEQAKHDGGEVSSG